MVDPGRLRHQVRIEQRSSTRDVAGEPEQSWTLFAERRADLVRTAGNELFVEGRNGRVPTLFKLRYLAGVEPKMRLLLGAKVYNILSAIDPDGRGVDLLVTTEELVEESP